MYLWFLFIYFGRVLSAGENDLMRGVPGASFEVNFKTYSGYLNAGMNGSWRMHYILHESQSDPANDPLLLWFEGGPGCSSLGTLFEQLGPFYANYDGKSLFENPYAWNKRANLLAFESPTGVGFSYDSNDNKNNHGDDDRSQLQNYNALKDFFRAFPRYADRTFFLSGESYAGVYVPMLGAKIIQGINTGDFPNPNFQGAAIGNGWVHSQLLMNSLVVWSAYHALVSPADWKTIKAKCATPGATHSDDYNYEAYMTTDNGLDFYGDKSQCGKLIEPLITEYPAGPTIEIDQYNFYHDCYDFFNLRNISIGRKKRSTQRKRKTQRRTNSIPISNDKMGGYTQFGVNTAALTNYDSTDNQWGFPCWNDVSAGKYFNQQAVQNAWNIEAGWSANRLFARWQDCNDPMYDTYNQTYPDMTPFFNTMIDGNKKKGFRILIYNGDIDTVCNFLGCSWFIEKIAKQYGVTGEKRKPWIFAKQLGGFNQHYNFGKLTMDVLTVKGAGHLVENDRPGPALQMIANFMFPLATGSDYSLMTQINVAPKLAPFVDLAGTTQMPTTPTRSTGISASWITVILLWFQHIFV